MTTKVAGFASQKSVQAIIKSKDGYAIIAGPGKTAVVLPPAEHVAAEVGE